VIDMAKTWGGHLARQDSMTVPQRIDQMFLTAFARHATEEELGDWQQALTTFADPKVDPATDQDAWTHLVQMLFNSKEFLYYR
jgi:hypothetical protein